MKRPLMLLAIGQIVGILFANATQSSLFILFSAIFLLGFVLITFTKNTNNRIFSLLLVGILAFYLVGGLEFLYFDKIIKEKYKEYYGEKITINGVINSQPEFQEDKITCIVKDSMGKVSLTISNKGLQPEKMKELDYGKIIEIRGVLNIPKGARNPGGFDYKAYLAGRGISATMYVKEKDVIVGGYSKSGIFFRLGNAAKKRIINVIDNSLEPKQAGLLNGMLTGYRGGISQDTKSAFSDSGLMHIIAVSGLHVGFIMIPFVFIFKKLGLKKIISNLLVILVLLFYISITGLQPSVLRAVIMATMILVSQMFFKEADTLTSISFACIVLLIANPHSLFSIGFQLSFIATLSIVLLNKSVNKILINLIKHIYKPITRTSDKGKKGKILKQITSIVSTTISAQIGILPLSILYFNKVSVISIVSNLLIAPFTGIVIILGLLMSIVGQISVLASKMIGIINSVFINIIIFVSEISAKLPFSVIKMGISSIIIIVIYYIIVWFFFIFKPKNKIKIKKSFYAYSFICVVVIVLGVKLIPSPLEVIFFDVGAGDSAFIRTQKGKTILIDGGGQKGIVENEPDTGEKILMPFLLNNGVTKLDLVVATHGHGDHIQGLYPVLKLLKIGHVILPAQPKGDEFDKIKDICKERKIKIVYCYEGNKIFLDKFTHFNVLNPPSGSKNMKLEKSSLNNNSLVLELVYKNVKMLFTGDIEREAEELIFSNIVQKAIETQRGVHVLKVPHHGSSTSSTIEFIELMKPKMAVISAGKNYYGHPAQSVINRYNDIGTKVFRTDVNGAVMLKSNGKIIKVKVMLANEY